MAGVRWSTMKRHIFHDAASHPAPTQIIVLFSCVLEERAETENCVEVNII